MLGRCLWVLWFGLAGVLEVAGQESGPTPVRAPIPPAETALLPRGAVLQFGAEGESLDLFQEATKDRAWTASHAGIIRQWDLNTGRPLQTIRAGDDGLHGTLHSFRVTPDGTVLARVGPMLARWQDGKLAGQVPLTFVPQVVQAEAFSRSGARLALSTDDPPAVLIDVATGRVVQELPGAKASRLVFSPDDRLIAGSLRMRLTLWNAADGEKRRNPWLGDTIQGLTFSPDSRRMFAALAHEGLLTLDVESGDVLGRLVRSQASDLDHPKQVALSPDQSYAAESEVGGKIVVWEVFTGRPVVLLDGHTQPVTGLAFLGDRRLVSVGRDGRGLVWDLEAPSLGEPRLMDRPLTATELPRLWRQLGDADGLLAHRAFVTLLAHPEQAIALIESPPNPENLIQRLIGELDHPNARVRAEAFLHLHGLSVTAEPFLRSASKEAPSVEAAARMQRLLDRLSGPEKIHERQKEQLAAQHQRLRARHLLRRIGTEPALALERRLEQGE